MVQKIFLWILPIFFYINVFSQTLQQEIQNRFQLAQQFEQIRNFEQAIQIYETLLATDSTNTLFIDGLHRCYLQLKKYPLAIQLLQKQLQRSPKDVALLARLGETYFLSGNSFVADSLWQKALTSSSQNQNVYRIIANVQYQNRLFDKAIQTYLQGRKTLNNPTLFSKELAGLYSVMMDYNSATQEYILLLLQDERQLEFIKTRIAFYTSKNEGLVSALSVTEKKLSETNNSTLRRLLLWLLIEGKNYEQAFEVAKKLEEQTHSSGYEIFNFAQQVTNTVALQAYEYLLKIETHPSLKPLAKFGYAKCSEEINANNDTSQIPYQKIITMYRSVAEEYPNTEIALQSKYRTAIIFSQNLADYDVALQIIDSLLLLPKAKQIFSSLLSTKSEIYLMKGNINEAEKTFSQLLQIPSLGNQERNEARLQLAQIQYYKGNFDSASVLLQTLVQDLRSDEANDALQLQSFIEQYKTSSRQELQVYAKAELCIKQKKYTEAVGMLDEIEKEFPNSVLLEFVFLKKGEIFSLLRQYQNAITHYQKLLEVYPKGIVCEQALFRIGKIYQNNIKNTAKSIEVYEQFLSQYPQSILTDEVRKQVRILRGDVL